MCECVKLYHWFELYEIMVIITTLFDIITQTIYRTVGGGINELIIFILA